MITKKRRNSYDHQLDTLDGDRTRVSAGHGCRWCAGYQGRAADSSENSEHSLPNLSRLPDLTGLLGTYNINDAPIHLTGPFFQSLGANGRSRSSCHRPAEAWSVSAAEVRLRFLLTQGLDPIFGTNDGSNCDHNIDTSTVEGPRAAYSLLLSRGLIRISFECPLTRSSRL